MNTPSNRPRGWYSRGYLPHLDAGSELLQTVTFRLADSLPAEALDRWHREIESMPQTKRKDELASRVEEYLDQGYGECFLRDDRLASMVENALLHFDGERYELHAWVIMANHVHTLFNPLHDHQLAAIVHAWKSFTAKEANRILHRQQKFWQADYFDRYIRTEEHYWQAKHYIEDNPVKAGLCDDKSHWRYSSAFERKGETGVAPARRITGFTST